MVDRKFTPKKSRGWGRSMPCCQTRKGKTMLENEWFAWRHQNKIGLKSRVQGPISSKLLKREVSSAANSMSYGLLLALNTAQRRYLFISKLSDCEIIITLTYTWSGDPGSVLTPKATGIVWVLNRKVLMQTHGKLVVTHGLRLVWPTGTGLLCTSQHFLFLIQSHFLESCGYVRVLAYN